MKRVSMLQGLAIASCLVGGPASAAAPEAEMPDDTFLEFLGDWESVDGEWIDPVGLADFEAEDKLADGGVSRAEKEGGEIEDES